MLCKFYRCDLCHDETDGNRVDHGYRVAWESGKMSLREMNDKEATEKSLCLRCLGELKRVLSTLHL